MARVVGARRRLRDQLHHTTDAERDAGTPQEPRAAALVGGRRRVASAPVWRDFTWRDGDRIVRFGRGALADAPGLLGDGYVLLSTERALQQAPQLAGPASTVHVVPSGSVDELAGELLAAVEGHDGLIVALGGGRVIDVAKALAAARPGRRAAAIPTTLSAAEMTWLHRHARGVPEDTPRARATVVVNDPALSASQPAPALFASAANSLGHAIEGAATTMASPVPTLAATEAVRLTAQAVADPAAPHRDALALAALLSGYAIDASWYGLHHVCSQTLRTAGAPHGAANAAMLPHTARALRERSPRALSVLDDAAGMPVEQLAGRLAQLAEAVRLRDIGVAEESLPRLAAAAAARRELELTPPAPSESELLGLYRSAF
jgi:alcohol dehydrogenase class IV